MFCFKCGAEIPEESKFCMHCGADLKNIGSNTSSKKVYPQILLGEYKLKKETINVFNDHIEIKRHLKNIIIPFDLIAGIGCIKDCTIYRTSITYYNNSVLEMYHLFGYKNEKVFFDITEMLRKIAEANNYNVPVPEYNPLPFDIGFITHI